MLARLANRVVLVFAAATLLGVFFAAQTQLATSISGGGLPWRDNLILSLADWYLWGALAPALIWLARRFPIERRQWLRAALVHVPGSLAFATLHLYLYSFAAHLLMPHWTYRTPEIFRVMFGGKFGPGFLTYWVIVGAASAFDFYERYRERELRASRLEAQFTQAQLSLLKMQLHPHFLFNTMNSISALMHRDVEMADRMLAGLGDLLRLSLDSLRVEEVSLRQELEFLSRYVDIEKMRFAERLDVRIDAAPAALEAAVPNLILQPLVENAIRYSMAAGRAPCRVVVAAEQRDGKLRVSITDNGPGLPPDARAGIVPGLGLSNTRARLEQLYNGRGALELEDAPVGGLRASIAVPYHLPPAPETAASSSLRSTPKENAP